MQYAILQCQPFLRLIATGRGGFRGNNRFLIEIYQNYLRVDKAKSLPGRQTFSFQI